MNTLVPTDVPQNVEHEMDILFARIDEKMANIRRLREEGEEIMRESRQISQSNRRELEELGERIARGR